jgi:hypothetical protein
MIEYFEHHLEPFLALFELTFLQTVLASDQVQNCVVV